MSNRLRNENSPYLLQHVDNPVDWFPWGNEALELAKTEDKPILLSIGYAACHWCHVMAHESFEDEQTAVYMNEHFVNIKVDREERPDIDSIYMDAVVAMTGQGGWPMTVFLTPDGRPFYGGTYYPPKPRFGMPSFRQLMQGIVEAWQNRRAEIEESATKIASHLGQQASVIKLNSKIEDANLSEELFKEANQQLLTSFDSAQGGFGSAPKFPPSMTIAYLLQNYHTTKDGMALHMAELTLKKMAYGGIYDQLGGGFARYSTDNNWLVPHFEKMLYDNALLSRVYLQMYQVTDDALYRRVVEETLDFVVREMRHEEGGFYSSYDADSEGVEGKFYVWQAEEVRTILGDDAPLFMRYYDVSDAGNWEGASILNVRFDLQTIAAEFDLTVESVLRRLEKAKATLYAVRAKRIWPGLDDKVLTAWNGLMLASFAEAGRFLNRADYLDIAIANAHFLYHTMRLENGRLLRTWKAGNEAKYNGYLEDYAYLADGLLALYQATFDEKWFVWARELADLMIRYFVDDKNGGFFDTSHDHEKLLNRPKTVQDNATPSANSVAAGVLLRLGLYTGEATYWEFAERMLIAIQPLMRQYPNGFGQWLTVASFMAGQPKEVAIVTSDKQDGRELLNVIDRAFRPHLVVALGQGGENVPLLAKRPLINKQATAYVCQKFVCKQPVNSPDALREQLKQ